MSISATTFDTSVALAGVTKRERILAIDALRGLALVVMALQHAANFVGVDLSAETYNAQSMELGHWTHWLLGLLTHAAAPTFWLLSGVSVALLAAGRRRAGESEGAITRFLLIRAALIAIVDLTLGTWLWPETFFNTHVLLSIAVCLALMSVLRLLPIKWLAVLIVGLLIGYQGLIGQLAPQLNQPAGFWRGLWLTNALDFQQYPALEFPVLGWLPIMGLGYVLGRSLARPIVRRPRTWFILGAGLLGLWFVLRLTGGFGDLEPYTRNEAWVYFFIMSKSPPSLTYQSFFLVLPLLTLGLFLARASWLEAQAGRLLIIFGQVSLFFFVIHPGVYRLVSWGLTQGLPHLPGIVYILLAWVLCMSLMFPLAALYRRLRRAHPRSILRYL